MTGHILFAWTLIDYSNLIEIWWENKMWNWERRDGTFDLMCSLWFSAAHYNDTDQDSPENLGHYRNSLLTYSPKMAALDEVVALGHYDSGFELKSKVEGRSSGLGFHFLKSLFIWTIDAGEHRGLKKSFRRFSDPLSRWDLSGFAKMTQIICPKSF